MHVGKTIRKNATGFSSQIVTFPFALRMMGPLEDSWGDASALPSLQRLNLAFNAFYNELPAAWGSNGSFPALKSLNLSSNYLTGIDPKSCEILCLLTVSFD